MSSSFRFFLKPTGENQTYSETNGRFGYEGSFLGWSHVPVLVDWPRKKSQSRSLNDLLFLWLFLQLADSMSHGLLTP